MIDRKALSLRTKYLAIRRANGLCPYCDSPLNVAFVGGAPTHFDHIEPLARGGSNEDDNIIAACAKCNGAKGTKTVFEFMCERMGFDIPIQVRFDPECLNADWFDTDTFSVALDEDDDGTGCDPDIELLPDFSDEMDDGPSEPEEPAEPEDIDDPIRVPPPREDLGWVPLGGALQIAIENANKAYGVWP